MPGRSQGLLRPRIPAAFPPDIAPAPAQLTSAVPSCTRSLPR